MLDEVLPGSNAKDEEIVFAYAGIRPLPWSGASATGAISRDHALHVFDADATRPYPVMTLVGGKWTTYRACAEQISESVLKHLGKPHSNSTLSQPIGGSKGLPSDQPGLDRLRADICRESGIADDIAATLLRRYGAVARDVAKAMSGGGTRVLSGGKYYEGEIRWIIRNERVTRLADIVLRRTLLPFEDGLSNAILDSIATIAADELGWADDRRRAEIEHTATMLRKRYRVRSLSPDLASSPERR